jgi:AcrR family transcriptional regulator
VQLSGESTSGRAGPLKALEQLRARELDREEKWRRDIALAAVSVSGQVGYRQLTVELILQRSGTSRNRFYKLFTDKAACYAHGYGLAMDCLAQDLLAPARHAGHWGEGFRPALERLARFLSADPYLAKGLLAEVHVAGEPAMTKRKEVFERLSHAIDAARREIKSRHSPPPITAEFILRSIEAAVISTLLADDPAGFRAVASDLTYIATLFYFGEAVAGQALDHQNV